MDRRGKILQGLDLKNKVGMEIGPLDRPTVRKFEGPITYVDSLDTAALREKHKGDPNLDLTELVDVDVVANASNLREALGHRKFDYIIASHVIEHVPDLIGWLKTLRALLAANGQVRLAVADRRFTFDFLRQETRVSDVVDAYLRKAKVPTPRAVMDFCFYTADVRAPAAWRGEVDERSLKRNHTPEGALYVARDALESGRYHDVHCWTFTPRSFATLFGDIATLQLLPFSCAGFHDTRKNDMEFFVTLRAAFDETEIRDSWAAMRDAPFVEPRAGKLERALKRMKRSLSWRMPGLKR